MTSASIFTAAVSVKGVEFCTGVAADSFAGQLASKSRLLHPADLARCVISSFKPASECIALSCRRGNNGRTIRQALRYSCCTMLRHKQSHRCRTAQSRFEDHFAVTSHAISELINFYSGQGL
jgi:hypothetical protein